MNRSELIPDQWWAVAPSRALLRSKPLGVTRVGRRLVLWRDADGRAQVADAACPHRGADLSLGRVTRGELECPYHGFRFRSDGACTAMPCEGLDAKIPPRMRLSTLPVVEEHGFVWAFSGDEARAATTPLPWIPDAPEASDDEAVRELTWDVRLSRVMEGMLDLHHFPFAHRRYSPAAYTRLDPYDAHVDDDGVLRTRGRLRKEGVPDSGFSLAIDVAFPGTLHLQLSKRLGGVVVCTPIDEERTWVGLRYYADAPVVGALPFVRRLLAELSVMSELAFIQPDDYRMLSSSEPREGGPEHGQLVHADKGIALWHGMRRRAIRGSLPLLRETHEAPLAALPLRSPDARPS